jgi:hypothetical protein
MQHVCVCVNMFKHLQQYRWWRGGGDGEQQMGPGAHILLIYYILLH